MSRENPKIDARHAFIAVPAQISSPVKYPDKDPIAVVDGMKIYHYREYPTAPTSDELDMYAVELESDPNIKLEFCFDVIPAPTAVVEYFNEYPGIAADIEAAIERLANKTAAAHETFSREDVLVAARKVFKDSLEGLNHRARLRNGGTLTRNLLEAYSRSDEAP